MLSNFGVGAVYALVGSVALIAVVVVALFGRETQGLTLEESAQMPVTYRRRRRVEPEANAHASGGDSSRSRCSSIWVSSFNRKIRLKTMSLRTQKMAKLARLAASTIAVLSRWDK